MLRQSFSLFFAGSGSGFINGSHASGGLNIMCPDVRHVGLLTYVLPVIIAGKKGCCQQLN